MTNTIVLPEGALVTSNEVDRPTVSASKGLSLNMAALPRETLYVLEDEITVELLARESHTLQLLREENQYGTIELAARRSDVAESTTGTGNRRRLPKRPRASHPSRHANRGVDP